MTFLFVGVAVLVSAFAVASGFARHRAAATVSLQPRPEPYRNIRILHNDHEIRAAAQRAYERERFIAHQADRRGAHFRQLTRPQSDLAFVRVVATGTPRDRELGAGDS
ncbi:MAG: hypothetical protein JWM72_4519 [Actinomycetia bacterium]|jgi:hypothetical protein|nr:hypothetical protein [Actinomycetes bacterium]MDQ1460906.1 hypothetical protein [Actinomycetota bacterium]